MNLDNSHQEHLKNLCFWDESYFHVILTNTMLKILYVYFIQKAFMVSLKVKNIANK
jgi:hypothetical protein